MPLLWKYSPTNLTMRFMLFSAMGTLWIRYSTRIEEEIESLFPQARILRMDRDTAASRKRYEAMLKGIEEYKYDILIGTQLIGKG